MEGGVGLCEHMGPYLLLGDRDLNPSGSTSKNDEVSRFLQKL